MRGTEAGHISEPKDMMDEEEPEEESEEDIFKEYEEDPEEEIEEDPEKDQIIILDEESEEDPEEDPEEEIVDLEEDKNWEFNEENIEIENPHLSSTVCDVGIGSKASGNELNVSPEGGGNNNSVKHQENSETSRTCKNSRWETPQVDETSKKRKTRWDENDSRDGFFNSTDFINHLELLMDPKTISLRMKLEEINKKLRSSETSALSSAGERSPSPEPIYDNFGIRINTRVARIKTKLMNERKLILSQLAATLVKHEPKEKFAKKLFIPEKEYPMYNFVGLILGPKGITKMKMEKETGARIYIKGIGSKSKESTPHDEKLHVLVEATEQKSLDSAVAMIEKLLIPINDQINDHKRAQLIELAKMKGQYKDPTNTCELCKEQGHKTYACPLQESTFEAVCCDSCGSLGHLTSNCNVSGKTVHPTNLYVTYLPPAVDDKRLKEMFLPFGQIESTRVMRYPTTGLSKGYGFVKFQNPLDAADAVKYMNGCKMDGRILAVRVAGVKPVFNPLIHASCNYPQTPLFNPNMGSSYSPYFGGYSVHNITEGLNVPQYVMPSSTTESTVKSNVSSGYDFVDRIPSSVPNWSQFPGDPSYPGSEFKSCFSSPALNQARIQMMPENESKCSFWGGSGFP